MTMTNNFDQYRGKLFAIAYRMLGSAMEAEDMVQETYLKWQAIKDKSEIRSPEGYLSTIITRLCLNHLNSAKVQRESYIGPWLPEPILTDKNSTWLSPDDITDQYESISIAFMILLESLTPVERAVFLLREVFNYDYVRIAEIIGKSEQACRKILSRAKKHIEEKRPRFQAQPDHHDQLVEEFMTAAQAGDLDGLVSLLSEDAVLWVDGGGLYGQAMRPVQGANAVAQFVFNSMKYASGKITRQLASINGRLGYLLRDEGQLLGALVFETDAHAVRCLYYMGNLEKLRGLTNQEND